MAEPRPAAREGPGARSRALGPRPSGRKAAKRPACPKEPRKSHRPDLRRRRRRHWAGGWDTASRRGVAGGFVARAARWRSLGRRSRLRGRHIADRSRSRRSHSPGRGVAAAQPPLGGRRYHGLLQRQESRRRRCSGCDSRPSRGGIGLVAMPTKATERSAARGPAPARPIHFRESGISLPSRSRPSDRPRDRPAEAATQRWGRVEPRR